MSIISPTSPRRAELKPSSGEQAIVDDVFLSPRVIDSRTFEEFSSLLKGLIQRSVREQESLQSHVEHARSLRDGVEVAARDLRQGLEQALRGAQAVDERLAKAQQAVERSENIKTSLAQLQTQCDEHLAAKVEELNQRCESALQGAQERFDHVALERATKISEIEEAIENRLGEGRRRAEQLEAQFESQLAQLEGDRAEKFVRLIDAIELRLDEAQGRLTEFDIGLEERLGVAVEDADRVFSKIERQRTQVRESIEPEHGRRLDTVERMLERVFNRLDKLEDAH